jgi:hypothetical protein
MRNTISLLSVAVLLAACGDKQETTAPAARVNPTPLAQSQSVVGSQSTVTPMAAGKVTAWTQAATYVSASGGTVIAPGGFGSALIRCPAGTTATGGGFGFDSYPTNVPPFVEYSGPDNTGTGWIVFVRNPANSGGNAYPRAMVRCAS